MAAKGRCREALPRLKAATAHIADKQLKYQARMATARCAMSLDQTETAVEALLLLRSRISGRSGSALHGDAFLLGTGFAFVAGTGGGCSDFSAGPATRGRSV